MNLYEKLGGLNFLKDNWEKKPLVIKNFIEDAFNLLDPSDLIEMACNEYFESRVIGKDDAWLVKHGPFENFDEISKTKSWTLINHNVNLYDLKLMQIEKELEFLPRWLFDDAMTTLSNEGSTVGAHIDNYNVFIVQLTGQRKWEIQHNPNHEYEKGLEVKVLKEFKPDESYILNPGDVIYIPPHVAHRGVSLTDSLSLSLGYKSLEDKGIIDQFAHELINEFESDDFYKTSFKEAVKDPFAIDEKILKDLKARILSKIDKEDLIENALLKFTAQTKKTPANTEEIGMNSFLAKLSSMPLYKDEFVRFSSLKKDEHYKVAVNDSLFQMSKEEYSYMKKLFALSCEDEINKEMIGSFEKLTYQLFLQGILFFNDEEQ